MKSTRKSKPQGRTAGARLISKQPFGESLVLHRYLLDNGLSLLVLPDDSAPVLSYHTFYRVGSKHEEPGKTGLAHLFEHLMFNETENLPYGEFDRVIEAAGGETNAATWTDWTHYYADLPASELALIVELEADRMANLRLRAAQVASEKEVVRNERLQRVDDDIEGTVFEQLYATAFRRHPYGWPTIGWMRDIEGFTPGDCQRFYKRYYAPNNATVIVAGDVEPSRVLALVKSHYGRLRAARLPQAARAREGPQRAERKLRLKWPTPTPKLALGYHAPALGERDHAVLAMLNEVLFVGRGSRMFRHLVRERELAAEVHGSIAPFAEPGLYEIWVSLRAGVSLREVLSAVDAELSRIAREPVPVAELSRVKSRVELAFLLGLETASAKAEQIGFYETVAGDAGKLLTRLQEYKDVTTDDLTRVASKVLDRRRRTRVEVVAGEVKR